VVIFVGRVAEGAEAGEGAGGVEGGLVEEGRGSLGSARGEASSAADSLADGLRLEHCYCCVTVIAGTTGVIMLSKS